MKKNILFNFLFALFFLTPELQAAKESRGKDSRERDIENYQRVSWGG